MKLFLVIFCDEGEFDIYDYFDAYNHLTKMDALSLAVGERTDYDESLTYEQYCTDQEEGSITTTNYLDCCIEWFDCAITIKEIDITVKVS